MISKINIVQVKWACRGFRGNQKREVTIVWSNLPLPHLCTYVEVICKAQRDWIVESQLPSWGFWPTPHWISLRGVSEKLMSALHWMDNLSIQPYDLYYNNSIIQCRKMSQLYMWVQMEIKYVMWVLGKSFSFQIRTMKTSL